MAVIIVFTHLNTKELYANDLQKGINIDIARKDYSLTSLKQIVDKISKNNGDYLQLHFSDDQNYALESKYFKNENQHLSKPEVRSLIDYSNDLGIMVIPDIDLPSHSKAWLDLLKAEDKSIYHEIISSFSDNTVDYIENKKALEVSKRQIKEVLTLFEQHKFEGEQKIVLGGDEVPNSGTYQSDFIHFMNELGAYSYEYGYEPQIWNDSITDVGIKKLYNKYSILYWKQKQAEDPQSNLSVEDFSENNFQIYNYNGYILYFLPSAQYSAEDIAEQQTYINNNYAYNKFNYVNNEQILVDSDNIKGSTLSFWEEKADGMTQKEVLQQVEPLIETYLQLN